MKKKVQSVIIASRGQNTLILCEGKLYSGIGITEIDFHHKAGNNSEIRITCDRLPVNPDESVDLRKGFKQWLDYLMGEVPAEEEENAPFSKEEGKSAL